MVTREEFNRVTREEFNRLLNQVELLAQLTSRLTTQVEKDHAALIAVVESIRRAAGAIGD